MSDDELLTALLHDRVRALNQGRESGEFVLLWLQCQRRIESNLAFAHAQRRANELNLPLVVYEGLRADYPYASARFHQFVLQGVADTARDCERAGVTYGFYLAEPGAPRGVLHRLAARAAVAVTDYVPTFIHPAQTRAFARRAPCRVELVDNAGVAPISLFPQAEIGARTLRPKLHRALAQLLQPLPRVPARVAAPRRFDWEFEPFHGKPEDGARRAQVPRHPAPVQAVGGRKEGLLRLAHFVQHGLKGYDELRNDPSEEKQSGLSPYLHFGFVGAAEVALAAQASEAPKADREALLEELLVRRELALNFCARVPHHESVEALPGWALGTLRAHEKDPRQVLDDHTLEDARTPDPIWNAAQRQLVREGRIHGYLRMLWGKLLIPWSKTPEDALRRMAWLNDKYALDGRDAISRANFLWCLGLHDRPFPERAVYGTVRSMTSASTAKKWDLEGYLKRYGI